MLRDRSCYLSCLLILLNVLYSTLTTMNICRKKPSNGQAGAAGGSSFVFVNKS